MNVQSNTVAFSRNFFNMFHTVVPSGYYLLIVRQNTAN